MAWSSGISSSVSTLEFDVDAFVADVRTEMEEQTLYNVTTTIGKVLRHHLPQDYSEALAILSYLLRRLLQTSIRTHYAETVSP